MKTNSTKFQIIIELLENMKIPGKEIPLLSCQIKAGFTIKNKKLYSILEKYLYLTILLTQNSIKKRQLFQSLSTRIKTENTVLLLITKISINHSHNLLLSETFRRMSLPTFIIFFVYLIKTYFSRNFSI